MRRARFSADLGREPIPACIRFYPVVSAPTVRTERSLPFRGCPEVLGRAVSAVLIFEGKGFDPSGCPTPSSASSWSRLLRTLLIVFVLVGTVLAIVVLRLSGRSPPADYLRYQSAPS